MSTTATNRNHAAITEKIDLLRVGLEMFERAADGGAERLMAILLDDMMGNIGDLRGVLAARGLAAAVAVAPSDEYEDPEDYRFMEMSCINCGKPLSPLAAACGDGNCEDCFEA